MPTPQKAEAAPLIRAAAAGNVAAFLRAAGVNPAPVFAESDVDIHAADDPYTVIPLTAFTRLLEAAATQAGDSAAGLKIGAAQDPADWGAPGFLLLNAPTVWDCLKIGEELSRPWQGATLFKAARDRDFISFEYSIRHPGVSDRDQDAELSLSFTASLVRRISRGRAAPAYVAFEHKPLSRLDVYRKHFGLTPAFGAPVNMICFDADAADMPNPAADARLFRIIRKHLQDLTLPALHGDNVTALVDGQIRLLLSGRKPCLEEVATALLLQPRTLQRRLKAEGVTYESVLSNVRKDEALRYLDEAKHDVKEISYILGFSDPSAFIKAFKRWAGATPGDYQASLRLARTAQRPSEVHAKLHAETSTRRNHLLIESKI